MSQYDQNYRGDFRKGNFIGIQITEIRILEADIELILGTIILEEVEMGLGKDSIQVTLGEMIEADVDQDEVQEQYQ